MMDNVKKSCINSQGKQINGPIMQVCYYYKLDLNQKTKNPILMLLIDLVTVTSKIISNIFPHFLQS